MIACIIIAVLLLTNDLTYFIGDDDDSLLSVHLGVKITCSCLAFISFMFLIFKLKRTNATVYEMIYQEKKHTKKVFKKSLQTFQSRIVSHVRASPTDFAKILSNPIYHKNFKFDIETAKGDE